MGSDRISFNPRLTSLATSASLKKLSRQIFLYIQFTFHGFHIIHDITAISDKTRQTYTKEITERTTLFLNCKQNDFIYIGSHQ